jgi:hypothetical protein
LRHRNLSKPDAKTLPIPILRCAETSANDQTFTLILKSSSTDTGPDRATKRCARTLSRRFRTVSCTNLPPHGDADAAYVIAVVKGP